MFETISLLCAVTYCNLVVVSEWAKHGIVEMGIQRPMNARALTACYVGVISIFISGIAHKYYHFELAINQNIFSAIAFGVPILWYVVFRYAILPPGVNEFFRAHHRVSFWILGNFQPGVILEELGRNLREFGMARGAESLFRIAIAKQEKGTRTYFIKREIVVDDETRDWNGNANIPCPACGTSMKMPVNANGGFWGPCRFCGAYISGRRMGETLFLDARPPKPVYVVTDLNRYNIAIAYEELALLYRMMNKLTEAQASLEIGSQGVRDLLDKNPENREYLALKSLVIFRGAEIEHVLGHLDEARRGYQESLEMDQKLGDQSGIETSTRLLSEISTS